MENLPTGNYAVESVYYEGGEKIGESTTHFSVTSQRAAFNAGLLFYTGIALLCLVTLAISAYSIKTYYELLKKR
jgi:hypothetical protein